jgi:hypothetical protein
VEKALPHVESPAADRLGLLLCSICTKVGPAPTYLRGRHTQEPHRPPESQVPLGFCPQWGASGGGMHVYTPQDEETRVRLAQLRK